MTSPPTADELWDGVLNATVVAADGVGVPRTRIRLVARPCAVVPEVAR